MSSSEAAPQGDGVPGFEGTIEGFEGRGVYVPPGMTAREVMVGARVLEKMYDVPPYESRSMTRAILRAIREGGSDNDQP
jgi:hypothetical protein